MRWVKKPIAAQMKRAQTNMTYVVDGNKCANIVPQGQYFQLINSTIAGRSDGVYTASKAIPANEVIDNTYFNQTSPIAEGAINKINGELAALNSNITLLMADKASDGIGIAGCSTLQELYEMVIGSPNQKGYGEIGTTNELTTLLGDPGFGRYTYAYTNRISKDCLLVVAPAWNKSKCAIKTILKCNTSFIQTPWLKIE